MPIDLANDAFAQALLLTDGPSAMAKALQVTPQAVCFWRDGGRALPERHGAAIEQACGFVIRRWHLWPDTWHRIWPELIGAEGAPDIPQEATHGA